ncbi:glycosyltransferase [Neptunomonas antarctica]|uniref:Glycosyltransferase involved in cell wall bisynthesis n=1 Tax=Neptunomonas antarctica TaxID=619304 RepID=A0A1N7J0Y8_9GAMM|nr:glycosyltransferase [Neptunomonas antarctica]SIS42881.1 Glycosyltransferase involved in cell wall bisynthesis [Neptunomonas antarctica]
MKVVQVLPDLNGGGVERGSLEVAEALVKAGHESIVISAGGNMVAELVAADSRHVAWDLGKKSLLTFRHIWAVRKWLIKEQPDILHLRSRMPAWVVWLAWRGLPELSRPHLVMTVHGLYSVSAYSAIMLKGEKVIAVSDTVKAYISTQYPDTDMSKVVRIFRGVDQDDFVYGYQPSAEWTTAWYQQYPQTQDKIILTLPGRLTRLKGHHDFIELIERLKLAGLNVCGLIVGGEDPKRKAYAQELLACVNDKGLGDAIVFTSARSDIRDIYSISNAVFSLSTKPESFGRTVLEALRMGVATIGYNHGGVGEILSAMFPAGKVVLGDAEALDDAVKRVIADKLIPAKSACFTKQQMLEKTLLVYASLIDTPVISSPSNKES